MLSQRCPLAKTWILWMKQAGFGVAGASGLVASVFLTLILIDSGSMNEVPLVSGMRQTLEVAGEKELSELGILHVVVCGHVVGVAGFQLVVQALHQLILCSGCDYLHASLHVAQHSFLFVRRRRV